MSCTVADRQQIRKAATTGDTPDCLDSDHIGYRSSRELRTDTRVPGGAENARGHCSKDLFPLVGLQCVSGSNSVGNLLM
jgi:hypothetical protein